MASRLSCATTTPFGVDVDPEVVQKGDFIGADARQRGVSPNAGHVVGRADRQPTKPRLQTRSAISGRRSNSSGVVIATLGEQSPIIARWNCDRRSGGVASGGTAITPAARQPKNATSDCWAVGYYIVDAVSNLNQTLIERWNGTSWKIVNSPNTSATQSNLLYGVTCGSTPDCWAVGYYYNASSAAQTLALKYTASPTPTPTPTGTPAPTASPRPTPTPRPRPVPPPRPIPPH